MLRPWLLPAVYERHQAGLGDFLTELRPVVALFLRFGGIDYDGDPDAGTQARHASSAACSRSLARYDGTLLQLTIGDKGSYLYAAFGAPTAHEDDARRAAHAALELRWRCLTSWTFSQPLQIGISRGVLRVGACGSRTRRTYGAMGDEVNLAARLMSRAAPGEVLISGRVQAALAADVRAGAAASPSRSRACPSRCRSSALAGAAAARRAPERAGLRAADGRARGRAGADRPRSSTWRWRARARWSASSPRPAWANRAWWPR